MKRFAPIIILLVFIVSCGRHGNTDGNKADIIVLNETNLFNVDSVALFLSNASSNQSDSSKKFFLNAIDIFKNNKLDEKLLSKKNIEDLYLISIILDSFIKVCNENLGSSKNIPSDKNLLMNSKKNN